MRRFYDDFVAERSLALLDSCYRGCGALLLMLQQSMSRIAIFPLGSRPYSCRAFTVNNLEARSDGV
ncbi:hypothetical protein [Pseudomonas sp. RT6P73]